MNKLLLISLVFISFSCRLYSQSRSTASAGATIIEPITISKTVETNFGTVAIIVAGTVEMIPTHIRAGLSSIVLPVEGTFTAASFVIEGKAAYAFTITVPPSPLEVRRGDKDLVVNSFSSDPILNPTSGLATGVYVSVTPLNLTVNYN